MKDEKMKDKLLVQDCYIERDDRALNDLFITDDKKYEVVFKDLIILNKTLQNLEILKIAKRLIKNKAFL